MARQRMGDQLAHEIGLRQSTCFPQFGVHTDRSEAWERIHFVDEDVLASEEEVDPGHAFAAKKSKCLDRKLLNTAGLLRRNICGNTQIGTVSVDVFCLIGIEAVLARRYDLAELRRVDVAFRLLQDGTFDLARSIHTLLDKDFFIVAPREFAGDRELLPGPRPGNTDR